MLYYVLYVTAKSEDSNIKNGRWRSTPTITRTLTTTPTRTTMTRTTITRTPTTPTQTTTTTSGMYVSSTSAPGTDKWPAAVNKIKKVSTYICICMHVCTKTIKIMCIYSSQLLHDTVRRTMKKVHRKEARQRASFRRTFCGERAINSGNSNLCAISIDISNLCATIDNGSNVSTIVMYVHVFKCTYIICIV